MIRLIAKTAAKDHERTRITVGEIASHIPSAAAPPFAALKEKKDRANRADVAPSDPRDGRDGESCGHALLSRGPRL